MHGIFIRKFIAKVSIFLKKGLQNGIKKRDLTTIGVKKEAKDIGHVTIEIKKEVENIVVIAVDIKEEVERVFIIPFKIKKGNRKA
jgi:hypothetical protein